MPREGEKAELLRKFSQEPEKYYEVELFREEGFVRRKCKVCGRYFWTLDPDADLCPDHSGGYGFIGQQVTGRRFSYVEAWRTIDDFFRREGHASVPRYPVVARWRPDLYFTVASIVDFQRLEGGRVVFEFPANPLVVPQACLRFNDLENVGFSGRHYTEFVMVGQHALKGDGGYWKDRTIELDFKLLTEEFRVPKEEVVFTEDVWIGPGAFGYSLEYFVRGLELGNAVFTEFEGTPESYRQLDRPVVDMGAGLERFSWLSYGTPASYDAVFEGELSELMGRLGLERDWELSRRFFSVSGSYDLSEAADPSGVVTRVLEESGLGQREYSERVKPLIDLYTVVDHSRALLFAIADGALPSNVGGGYNLRVILRRAQGIIESNGWDVQLVDVAELLARGLRPIFPELLEAMPSVQEVLDVELRRYRAAKDRVASIVESLRKSGRRPGTDDLIKLYESHGVTPELLVSAGIIEQVPPDFYSRLVGSRPQPAARAEQVPPSLSDLPPTRKLYYEDKRMTRCRARVLRALAEINAVVLDRTIFYPRGGGQEPDRGTIGGSRVRDVEKVGEVIVHYLEGPLPREGEEVECELDAERRAALMRHHTATHVLNGAARAILGPWVWQHSAYKEEDKARLDITHHSPLTREQVEAIERLANSIVQMDMPVEVQVLPRGVAESLYGFRLYQGGAIPSGELRVVKVGDFDVEACGGTHVSSTGEIGMIKVIRAERIQDGVVRLEFVAGRRALELVQGKFREVEELASMLGSQPDSLRRRAEELLAELDRREKEERALASALASALLARGPSARIGPSQAYVALLQGVSQKALIDVGDALVRRSRAVFVGASALKDEGRTLIVVISSDESVDAGRLASGILRALGGQGGGRGRIGQGSAPRPLSEEELLSALAGARSAG